eukprot:jgi/Psemu1/300435/fgenesh1_kg.12_\
MMKPFVCFLFSVVTGSSASFAFLVPPSNDVRVLTADSGVKVNRKLRMVGGRGWDNSDFLSSLSGDDEEREKSQEDYQEFSDRRAEFNARQAEIMKTPQAQAFMKQRQEQQFRHLQQEQEGVSEDGIVFGDVTEGSGGGTRMGRMMAQAKRMQGQRSQSNMIGGFQQQILGPLDDDGDDEEEI